MSELLGMGKDSAGSHKPGERGAVPRSPTVTFLEEIRMKSLLLAGILCLAALTGSASACTDVQQAQSVQTVVVYRVAPVRLGARLVRNTAVGVHRTGVAAVRVTRGVARGVARGAVCGTARVAHNLFCH